MIYVLSVVTAAVALQAGIAFYFLKIMREERKNASSLHAELLTLTNRMESFAVSPRETMKKHYNKIIDELSVRVPMTVAAQAGQAIFETESRILNRLAEIEPALREDMEAQAKLKDLIHQMESLERTLISLTSETVQAVLSESRDQIFNDQRKQELSVANGMI